MARRPSHNLLPELWHFFCFVWFSSSGWTIESNRSAVSITFGRQSGLSFDRTCLVINRTFMCCWCFALYPASSLENKGVSCVPVICAFGGSSKLFRNFSGLGLTDICLKEQ